MDFRVVIFEVHALDLVPRQLPYWLTEIRVLQKCKARAHEKALQVFRHTHAQNLERKGVFTEFLLQSMKPIWPLGYVGMVQ